jgi:hypothetical protein
MILTKESSLPYSNNLNTKALAGLFNNTTNSYKFIFFISLIDILKRRDFVVNEPISFTELTIEMLANAWYPHSLFKLSFGTQDTISKKLDSLVLEITDPTLKFHDTDKNLLRNTIKIAIEQGNSKRLMEFVPFRILSPFLEQELKDIDKAKWGVFEEAMPLIVNHNFHTRNPLYKFNSDERKKCTHIIFNTQWAEYFKENFSIIHGWASWHWLQYMQKRNPSSPNLINKLFVPSRRSSLNKQSIFWKKVLQSKGTQDFHCIYSGAPLTDTNFSLDHYLPWSFVAHDQIWNLIPTPAEINSSKSNNLPHDSYLNKFIKFQHQGLIIAKDIYSSREFDNKTEPFVADLPLNQTSDLLNFNKLHSAYTQTIIPLHLIAKNQGFSSSWLYSE